MGSDENGDNNNAANDVVDCAIKIDGSWGHRGVKSIAGLSSAISVDIGEVLDRHFMCSFCPGCKKWEGKENTDAYLEW